MLDAVEGTERDRRMPDRSAMAEPASRVARLRERILSSSSTGVSIDRARIETRVMGETEREPIVTRRAKVFEAVVREMPISIEPDELIVGCFSGKPFCWNVSPASGPGLEKVLFDTSSRKGKPSLVGVFKDMTWDTASLSQEDKRDLKETLIPYWKDAGKYEKTMSTRNLELSGSPRSQHVGHNCVAFDKVLEKGFVGIKAEAEERLSRIDLDNAEEADKAPFLEGVITAMAAAAEIGKRYAALARGTANPPRTFYEAIQAYFFTWILLFWEQPEVASVSPGSADQYLYPYYESDIRDGRITKEYAQELVDCYILKLNQIPNESLSTHLNVGGLKANGSDATNELTYVFIEAMMHTRLMAPVFSVQVHSKTPDDLLIKASELCALGTGHPQFINHDVAVAQTLARGSLGGPPVTLADARSSTPVGCVELAVPGKDAGWTGGTGLINYAACMEYVLTNGVRRIDNKKMGEETGDPRQFTSFDDVIEAYRRQVASELAKGKRVADIHEGTLAEMAPTVYESALIDDCIEKGVCRESGGAHFNSGNQILPIGPSDAADSLTAIRKLVFEDKTMTMDELCSALDHNFSGYEALHRLLLNAPKYGNDEDYADEQATLVNHIVASEGAKIGKNVRGGNGGLVGGSAWWLFATIGAVVGALPSGRRTGEPLNDAHSPCSGFDVKGPTAVLKSMGKIDNVELNGGVLLNIRLDPEVFSKSDGIRRMADLVRAFIDQKILHVQFNVVSSETLTDAQKEPEKHQDLLVKVAGYSVFFVQLTKPNQDAIIARTVHGI